MYAPPTEAALRARDEGGDSPAEKGTSEDTSSSDRASSRGVAVPTDEHSAGHLRRIQATEPWVLAALRHLEVDKSALVLGSGAPNDGLASQILETLAQWIVERKTAGDVGVESSNGDSWRPADTLLSGAKQWMRKYISGVHMVQRDTLVVHSLDDQWGKHIPGARLFQKQARAVVRDRREKDGTLYHGKHDVSVTFENMVRMMRAGYRGDPSVGATPLAALETAAALALYFPTGARKSELSKMFLQCLGHEAVEDSGERVVFHVLKLNAFETKTKLHHLSQILAHPDPLHDGVALYGLSLLLRAREHGAPPFETVKTERSWRLFHTPIESLMTQLRSLLALGGVEREDGDPLGNLGRHFYSRKVQHTGVSGEGARARTGHQSRSAYSHYTEMPLPDMRKAVGRDHVAQPAHLHPSTEAPARAVLHLLMPEFEAARAALEKRNEQVKVLPHATKVRKEERLTDRARLLRVIDMVTTTALRAVVARPRDWQGWAIVEDGMSVWEEDSRVLRALFAGKPEAIEAMTAVRVAVRRCEDSEIAARKMDPSHRLAEVVREAHADASQREDRHMAMLMRHMPASTTVVATTAAPAPPNAPPPAPAADPPMRVKHEYQSQGDTCGISKQPTLQAALDYAKEELAPRERAEGSKWRKRTYPDGREDNRRHKIWLEYRDLAVAVGDGTSVEALEARAATLGSRTKLFKELRAATARLGKDKADALVASVLF